MSCAEADFPTARHAPINQSLAGGKYFQLRQSIILWREVLRLFRDFFSSSALRLSNKSPFTIRQSPLDLLFKVGTLSGLAQFVEMNSLAALFVATLGVCFSFKISAPYLVMVQKYGAYICDGSLISARYVLTASQCEFSWIRFDGELTVNVSFRQ